MEEGRRLLRRPKLYVSSLGWGALLALLIIISGRAHATTPKISCPSEIIDDVRLDPAPLALLTEGVTAASVEKYLAAHPFTSLGIRNDFIQICIYEYQKRLVDRKKGALWVPTEAQKVAIVTEFYSSMSRMVHGLKLMIQSTVALEQLLGLPLLTYQTEAFSVAAFPQVERFIQEAKDKCAQLPRNQLKNLALQTAVAADTYFSMREEVERLTHEMSAPPRRKINFKDLAPLLKEQKNHREILAQYETRLQELQSTFPWLEGERFQEMYLATESKLVFQKVQKKFRAAFLAHRHTPSTEEWFAELIRSDRLHPDIRSWLLELLVEMRVVVLTKSDVSEYLAEKKWRNNITTLLEEVQQKFQVYLDDDVTNNTSYLNRIQAALQQQLHEDRRKLLSSTQDISTAAQELTKAHPLKRTPLDGLHIERLPVEQQSKVRRTLLRLPTIEENVFLHADQASAQAQEAVQMGKLLVESQERIRLRQEHQDRKDLMDTLTWEASKFVVLSGISFVPVAGWSAAALQAAKLVQLASFVRRNLAAVNFFLEISAFLSVDLQARYKNYTECLDDIGVHLKDMGGTFAPGELRCFTSTGDALRDASNIQTIEAAENCRLFHHWSEYAAYGGFLVAPAVSKGLRIFREMSGRTTTAAKAVAEVVETEIEAGTTAASTAGRKAPSLATRAVSGALEHERLVNRWMGDMFNWVKAHTPFMRSPKMQSFFSGLTQCLATQPMSTQHSYFWSNFGASLATGLTSKVASYADKSNSLVTNINELRLKENKPPIEAYDFFRAVAVSGELESVTDVSPEEMKSFIGLFDRKQFYIDLTTFIVKQRNFFNKVMKPEEDLGMRNTRIRNFYSSAVKNSLRNIVTLDIPIFFQFSESTPWDSSTYEQPWKKTAESGSLVADTINRATFAAAFTLVDTAFYSFLTYAAKGYACKHPERKFVVLIADQILVKLALGTVLSSIYVHGRDRFWAPTVDIGGRLMDWFYDNDQANLTVDRAPD